MAENTLDELRREIAERLGWTEFTHKGPRGGFLYGIDPQEGYARIVPGWPRDTDAALALCLEIARDKSYGLVIEPIPASDLHPFAVYVAFKAGNAPARWYVLGNDPAEALAWLALAALKE